MSTKKQVIKKAKELGVDVEHESMFGYHATMLYAPDGGYFGASSSSCCSIRHNWGWPKSEHWDAVMEDLLTLEDE